MNECQDIPAKMLCEKEGNADGERKTSKCTNREEITICGHHERDIPKNCERSNWNPMRSMPEQPFNEEYANKYCSQERNHFQCPER
mmetsp:Transcript_57477/g.68644  ORF Transcript_57477/g.68644 Transcript_57477/m.68644 type:complete len:86 (+) Transcript_57477:129-386(+)